MRESHRQKRKDHKEKVSATVKRRMNEKITLGASQQKGIQ